jgi:hypothetical protein
VKDAAAPGSMTEPADLDAEQARATARSLKRFFDWALVNLGDAERNPVVALVNDFLGDRGEAHSVVSRRLASFEHVNLQAALDAWMAEPGRTVEVHGVILPPHFGTVGLQQLIAGEPLPPIHLAAPPLVDLPDGPGSTRGCFLLALLLVADAEGRYALLVSGPSEHDPGLQVQIAGIPLDRAQAVQDRLAQLRHELNVYRGQLVDVALTPNGAMQLSFGSIGAARRDDVILPDAVLGRIERHALGIAGHRDAMRAAGQHLKRGLLLYGPPGTGKTHTTRYLVGAMDGYTRLVLTGTALRAVAPAAELARELEPAVIVLEDVDLVAEERSFGPSGNPVLFDLLDAMDGAAPDADLLFVLTTNRADLLEPALAARPGRVDIAVQVDLPDADGRARLLELYGRSLPLQLSDADRAAIVDRTQGVTASFLKELLRRSMLGWLAEDPAGEAITAAHVSLALDDLLDTTQQLTRSLLGVGVDPTTLPAGGGLGSLPPERPMRSRR